MNTHTGRFAFLRQLQAEGIECIFGNPGSSEQNLIDALNAEEFASLKYYLALHEGPAVGMADSYARARKKPALVQLHSYAGLANGLGMMYYARRGYTPMVVFAGEAGLPYEAMDGQMAADLVGIAKPFVKSDHNGPCAWRVVDSSSLLRLLRRALKTAATAPMGPVFLALPMDILDQPNNEVILPSQPVDSRVLPVRENIIAAAGLLAGATHPLILMGDGIAASGAQEELSQVALLLGAQVWGVNHSEINLPMSHPLYQGETGHMFGSASLPVTSGADVVLVCGTTLMPEVFPATGQIFAPGAKVIHFDLNSFEIGKNFPMTLSALADPKRTLGELAEELKNTMSSEQRKAAIARVEQSRQAKQARLQMALDKDASSRGKVPMHAPEFAELLGRRLATLPRAPILFDEALTHSPELMRYLVCDLPGTWFQTRAGMLGTGLPGAIGLKIAHPDRLVIGFAGDGGSMQSIQALNTAARYKIGAKFVVCNNGSYRILKYNLRQYWASLGEVGGDYFPDVFDLAPSRLRFDRLAEGMGVAALRVESATDIPAALDRMLADQDEPFLLDLVLSGEL